MSAELIREWWPALVLAGNVAFFAFMERMRRTFASREEVNAVGDKYNALQSLYLQVRETADEARRRAEAADKAQQAQWGQIAEHVIRPLERVSESMQEMSETMAVQTASLEAVCRWVEKVSPDAVIPSPTPSSRRKRGGA